MDYDQFFTSALRRVHDEGRYRYFADLERQAGKYPQAIYRDGKGAKPVNVWCSNDYLSMGQHPAVHHAMHEAIDSYGAGAGGTRNISGTNHLHIQLEEKLAALHKKEKALLFTSGYVANEATLSTLLTFLPDCVVFSDECNHASIIHGIRYSGAEKRIFKHNDVADLEAHLADYPKSRPKVIVFESLYSMDGDFAPISAICDLAEKYGAMTYVDEVHAIGIYGHKGMGCVEKAGEESRIDILQSNFGKAVGIIGGYITASNALIDFVRSYAPPFIFTTALPPAVVAGCMASIAHFNTYKAARNTLWEVVKLTKHQLRQAGFEFFDAGSHIIPLIVGEARLCKQVTDRLLSVHDIYVQPINYPTVPKGTERLRVTPMPCHTPEMVKEFTLACTEVWDYFGLKRKKQTA